MVQRYLRIFGEMEVEVQQAVAAVEKDVAGVEVGYYPNFPEVHLSLTARGSDRAVLEARPERGVAALSRELGDVLMGLDGAPLEEVVGRLLRQQGKTLAAAESCSGGLICHRLTNISGSSDYFQGGVVTYSNQAKMDLLAVPPNTLEQHGAVSPDTARAMALGVQKLFHADYGLAVTGIAGPPGAPRKSPWAWCIWGWPPPVGGQPAATSSPGTGRW